MENRIKEVLRSKGLKAGYICQKINLNPSILSLYINNTRKPNQKRLRQLASALNCSIKDLYPQVKVSRINFYKI